MAESQGKGALRVESRPLSSLRCDPNNARRHDPPNLEAIRASLERFGQQKPIVVTADGRVVAGNGTLEAARALGWSAIDVVVTDLDGVAATAYAISDNRSSELGTWDDDALQAALREVAAHADLLDATGFDVGDIEIEIDEDIDAEPQVERADELQAIWKTEPWQLWQLGDHRLLCGDSTKREDVERVMGGERATIVFTDPPYGVSIAAKNRAINLVDPGKGGLVETDIVDDDLSPEDLRDRLMPAFENVCQIAMAEDCTVFVSAPQRGDLCMMMMMMMRDAGLPPRHVLIWRKSSPTFSMGRLDYDYQHEPILMTWGKRHKRPMAGEHKSSVWDVAKPSSSKLHPTMKPVELAVNALLNHTDAMDIAYEPFSGSGTTIIACEQLGRRCRAIEIAPAYVAVALQRWADATGKTPELLT
jgi:DNA modification methylase